MFNLFYSNHVMNYTVKNLFYEALVYLVSFIKNISLCFNKKTGAILKRFLNNSSIIRKPPLPESFRPWRFEILYIFTDHRNVFLQCKSIPAQSIYQNTLFAYSMLCQELLSRSVQNKFRYLPPSPSNPPFRLLHSR